MKNFFSKSLLILLWILLSTEVFAGCDGWFQFWDCEVKPPYCTGSECSLSGWVEVTWQVVSDLISHKTLTEYAQDFVVYFLSFVTLISVIYIMYAGFRVLTGAGDEEQLKKAKSTILYVCIGIIIIWLAYTIVSWAIQLAIDPNGFQK